MSVDIYSELNGVFEEIDIPYGMGFYLGDGLEPVFIVYLVYGDDTTGRAEDKIAQVTHRVKVDIIARAGASFTEAERKVKIFLGNAGYSYKNGEGQADTKEPYDYHRVLYFDRHLRFGDLDFV